MVRMLARRVSILVLPFVLFAMVTLQLTRSHPLAFRPLDTELMEIAAPSLNGGGAPAPHDAEPEATVDLSGNDITDAVAEYKLDATGSLYELHSPQTELPRLPSPKS